MDNTLPPLVLQGVNRLVSLLDLWDSESEKLSLNIDRTIYYAHQAGIEDIIVSAASDSPAEEHPVFQHIQSRHRKSYKHTRFHFVVTPLDTKSGVDAMRHIEAKLGSSLFVKGFLFLSGDVVVTSAENFTSLWAHHQAKRKNAMITLSQCHAPKRPHKHKDDSAVVKKPSQESLPDQAAERTYILSDQKTSEIVAYHAYSGFRPVDMKAHLRGNVNLRNNPPETIVIDPMMQYPSFFAASADLIQHLRDNFDYEDWIEVIDSILSSEIKAEGTVYIHKQTKPYFYLSTFKLVFEYLAKYQTSLDGPVWVYDAENEIVHHCTTTITSPEKLRNVLIMAGVVIDGSARATNCVILTDSSLGKNTNISCGVIVDKCSLEDNMILKGPALISSRGSNDLKPLWVARREENGLKIYVPEEVESDFHDSMFPNDSWREKLREMEASVILPRDQDQIYDLLFEDSSSSSSSSYEKEIEAEEVEDHVIDSAGVSRAEDLEFSTEIQGMLLSVVSKPSHLKHFELELRTYRLSSFKSRKVVLNAIMPILLAASVQLWPDLARESFDWEGCLDFFEDSGMEFFLESVVDDDYETYDIIYRSFASFCASDSIVKIEKDKEGNLETKIPNLLKGSKFMFHRFCMMTEVLDHETYLDQWLKKNEDSEMSVYLQHPVLARYLRSLA